MSSIYYPFDIDDVGRLSPGGVQNALWDYSSIDVEPYVYCSLLTDAGKKCVAAIQKGILNGNPTIMASLGGSHARLVKGGQWDQLSNYQPQVQYLTTADPALTHERNDTIAYWLTSVGNYDDVSLSPIMVVGQFGSAQAELDTYEAWGGTYYAEEDPPDGCDQCPPIIEAPLSSWFGWVAALLKPSMGQPTRLDHGGEITFAGRGQSLAPETSQTPKTNRRRPVGPERQSNHAVRRVVYVPKPHVRVNAVMTAVTNP
jgi:hypothetical protein